MLLLLISYVFQPSNIFLITTDWFINIGINSNGDID